MESLILSILSWVCVGAVDDLSLYGLVLEGC